MAVASFSQRIARRLHLWWGRPLRWHDLRPGDRLHRLREWYTVRRREDPDAVWRCCEFWQRNVIQKWNGREFAQRYGCDVPQLYRFARASQLLPLESLPPNFVVRPIWGHSRSGVFVVDDGRELLRHEPATAINLRRHMRARTRGRTWSIPILVEEFVRTPRGEYRLPVEYKCHSFAGAIAGIQVVRRDDIRDETVRQRIYTTDWVPFPDPMYTKLTLDEVIEPPPNLDEMLRLAACLGRALETYIRVDFFCTDRGWVLNEFSSTPAGGDLLTPYADEFFGAFWQDTIPDAV